MGELLRWLCEIKALSKSCSTLNVPCETHFIRMHEGQPRFGAELVLVLYFHKITVLIYNSSRRTVEPRSRDTRLIRTPP